MFDNARAMPAMIKICIKVTTAKTPTHRTGNVVMCVAGLGFLG